MTPTTNSESSTPAEPVAIYPEANELTEAQRRLGANKKCKVCGAQAMISQTIAFHMDTGFGWVVDKVYLCETHAESLTEGEIDQLYVKQRMSHLSKQRISKSKPQVAANPAKVNKPKPAAKRR